MRVEKILDDAQSYLHDALEEIWTREELLRRLNDGYRQFIAESLPTVRVYQLDVPARDTGAGSQEWEDEHVEGNFAKFTISAMSLSIQCTYRWEAEMLSSANVPQDGYACVTHDWERCYVAGDNIDSHFRFVLAKTHEMPRYAFWGDKKLGSRAVSELDLRDQRWWVESGEPIIYLNGLGRELSFEIFEVTTQYTQAYFLRDADAGAPREITSDASREYETWGGVDRWDYAYSSGQDYLSVAGLGFRFTIFDSTLNYYITHAWEADTTVDSDDDSAYVFTYPWEADFLSGVDAVFLGIGSTRGLESEDRQYVPMAYDAGRAYHGVARDFHSSDDSISIYEHTVPTRPLDEDDEPQLIPVQLHKFLKYYIIGQCLSQPGEAYRPDLAQHWIALYQLGVGILAALATPSFSDSSLARGQVNEVRVPTPPKVRLPSTYPRVRGR